MQREINPQLFQQPGHSTAPSKQVPQRIEADVKELTAQMHQLKMQNQMLERKLEQMNLQYQELTNKFMTLASKANERRVTEGKMQDLIDRHNTLIMNFENRMTHMSRIISEQELKLYNATATVEDARREIARLRSVRPV